MKFDDLKIGMKVKAIDNYYNFTSKDYKWIGVISEIKSNQSFSAKTESTISTLYKDKRYFNLQPQHFEKVVDQEEEITQKKKIATKEEIPLKVIYNNKNIYVIYKGKEVARAECSEEDDYDEEFGLNLALRRFCKTLKNEHNVIITKTKIESVDDYL